MYRINLFPEYARKKRAARNQALRTGLLCGLIGLQILALGALALSASLLSEQASSLRGAITRISTRVPSKAEPESGVKLAQEMAQVRLRRLDWSPKLATISARIHSNLQLEEVTGVTAAPNRPARFEMKGRVLGEASELEQLAQFIEALRLDGRVAGDFPDIQLGTLMGGDSGQFNISCSASGEGSP